MAEAGKFMMAWWTAAANAGCSEASAAPDGWAGSASAWHSNHSNHSMLSLTLHLLIWFRATRHLPSLRPVKQQECAVIGSSRSQVDFDRTGLVALHVCSRCTGYLLLLLIIGEQIATHRHGMETHQSHANLYKYRRAAYRSCLEIELHVVIGCTAGGWSSCHPCWRQSPCCSPCSAWCSAQGTWSC